MTSLFILIFKTWITKFKLLFFSLLIITIAAAVFHISQKTTTHFNVKLYGSTLQLDHMPLSEYLQPIVEEIINNKIEKAAALLGTSKKSLTNVKNISVLKVHRIAEEAEVRYEFILSIDIEKDTSGIFQLENALLSYIKRHPIVLAQKQNKTLKLKTDKNLIDSEINRIDSLLKNTNAENFAKTELLKQRKVELLLKLNELTAKTNEFYDVRKIYGLNDFIVEVHDEARLFRIVVYWSFFLLTMLTLFPFLLVKDIRQKAIQLITNHFT